MSKSLNRVKRHLAEMGLALRIEEFPEGTTTAEQAAAAVGCSLDQIVKSVIFLGETSGRAILFLTAGSNQVDPVKARAAANEGLGKANAGLVRAQTGFAIGGVSPFGHLSAIRTFCDPRLLAFDRVWAAAGTPRHVFAIDPDVLVEKTKASVTDFT